MMSQYTIPNYTNSLYKEMLKEANNSIRKRYSHILHETGDEFNHAFNLMLNNSYMQPHYHPSPEKVEKIHIIKGSVTCLFFNNIGEIIYKKKLDKEKIDLLSVPAYQWHTYIIDTEIAVTYETMLGKYDPKTWKTMANWAPKEQTEDCDRYLKSLKDSALDVIG